MHSTSTYYAVTVTPPSSDSTTKAMTAGCYKTKEIANQIEDFIQWTFKDLVDGTLDIETKTLKGNIMEISPDSFQVQDPSNETITPLYTQRLALEAKRVMGILPKFLEPYFVKRNPSLPRHSLFQEYVQGTCHYVELSPSTKNFSFVVGCYQSQSAANQVKEFVQKYLLDPENPSRNGTLKTDCYSGRFKKFGSGAISASLGHGTSYPVDDSCKNFMGIYMRLDFFLT
jgi:hypothetical protein